MTQVLEATPTPLPIAAMTTSSYLTPSPIAAMVGSPIKAKQTSLLTSALGGGDKPGGPVHPFLSSNSPAAPCPTCNPQGDGSDPLEQVLDKWDRAWMGSVSDSHISGTSPSPGTSPRGSEQTAHGPLHPSRFGPSSSVPMPMPGVPSTSTPLSIGGSSLGKPASPTAQHMPPLPATPPPAHRPLGGPSLQQDNQSPDDEPLDASDIMVGSSIAMAASGSGHRGTPTTRTGPSLARPINVHHPIMPQNAKGPNDFASVFFSPLPYSYLNMARSDSTDQLLVNSVGSPDITLRNGRLAANTTITHVEWPVDVSATISPGLSTLTGMDSTGDSQPLPDLTDVAAAEAGDVTEHGTKRRGCANGLTLVQQTLAQASRLSHESNADSGPSPGKQHSSVSPDSVLSGETVEVRREAAVSAETVVKATSASGITTTATTIAASTTVVTHTVHLGSSVGSSDASILLRPASARPGSPAIPPFSSHPAVAGLPACLPVSPLPGLQDHLKGTGYQSIAAALETQTQSAQPLRLVAAAAMIPHVDKADKGGEDAYCIVDVGLGSIGVADGVSGWAEEGIDPAEYSRTLMRFCADALEEAGTEADAREVIRYAHKSTVMPGSSTVCLGVMKPGGRLQVANLGDSGVRIIRDGRIIFASAAQQHMFNMPYQLSHPSIIDSPDDADSADVTTIDVVPGDIIVMATDGLYDNMFDDEIAAICYDVVSRRRRALLLGSAGDAPPTPGAGVHPETVDSLLYTVAEAEALAVQITRTAHRYAQNPYQRTPWSVASCEQGYGWARYFAKGGGKMDDCTVIVSFVQPEAGETAQHSP